MTRWKPIPGYSLFEASDDGRIRRVSYPAFTKGPRQPLPAIMRPYVSNTGYLDISICGDARGYTRQRVHRLVLLAFKGPTPDGKPMGCHIDGDKFNNRADNLYWGDAWDNAADQKRNGAWDARQQRWKTEHPTAKLSVENVRHIKRRLQNGETIRSIADSYGVSPSTIAMISAGRNWAWVEAA